MKIIPLILALVFVLTPVIYADEIRYYDVSFDDVLQDELFQLCDEYSEYFGCEIDPKMMLAVIQIESSYTADIVSHGNYSLCQINKVNHGCLNKELGITDFLDPIQNMRAGVYLYGSYLSVTDGDIHRSAMMYQYGETGAKRRFDIGIYESVYSRKLVEVMENLKLK
jgi:Soluble lytic murein transglycosylase and related regulatory proteins (some contain LysM/invasin domains)